MHDGRTSVFFYFSGEFWACVECSWTQQMTSFIILEVKVYAMMFYCYEVMRCEYETLLWNNNSIQK